MFFFKGIIKTFEKFSRIEELAKGYRCISVETLPCVKVSELYNIKHLLVSLN